MLIQAFAFTSYIHLLLHATLISTLAWVQAIAAQLLWHATQRSESNRLALFEAGGIKDLCTIVNTGSPQARYVSDRLLQCERGFDLHARMVISYTKLW